MSEVTFVYLVDLKADKTVILDDESCVCRNNRAPISYSDSQQKLLDFLGENGGEFMGWRYQRDTDETFVGDAIVRMKPNVAKSMEKESFVKPQPIAGHPKMIGFAHGVRTYSARDPRGAELTI